MENKTSSNRSSGTKKRSCYIIEKKYAKSFNILWEKTEMQLFLKGISQKTN